MAFTVSKTAEYGSVFNMHLHGQLSTIVGAEDAPEVFNNPELSFLASQARVCVLYIYLKGCRNPLT